MSAEPITLTDAAIYEILYASMPDGSPISTGVKMDAILAAAGIESVPAALRSIIARGINQRRYKRLLEGGRAHV